MKDFSAATALTTNPEPLSNQPGVFLSLDAIRRLPLSQEARLSLLSELRHSAESGLSKAHLMAEQAELYLRCCEHAYNTCDWLQAIDHHDALLELVLLLARALPEKARSFWSRYGELLAFLTAAVHPAVISNSTSPPPQPLRAELCWRLAERLKIGRQLPFTPPEWLAVLEQQLVQDGAAYWTALIDTDADDPTGLARRRSFSLLIRLDELLAPAPSWIIEQAREHLCNLAQSLLAQHKPESRNLAQLCSDLEALPLDPEDQSKMAVSIVRARLSLELLAPDLGGLIPQIDSEAFVKAEISQNKDLPAKAMMVLRDFNDDTASPLEFNVAPLLVDTDQEGDEFNHLDEALEEFVWHLPRGSTAIHAAPALLDALEPAWRNGLRLSAKSFEKIAYLSAAWQRRLTERLDPLPILDWHHSMLIELDSRELAALKPILEMSESLQPALAELRRQHHNDQFWREKVETPWMCCPPPLEALRRLHCELGFYAQTHQPFQELNRWGMELSQVLHEAESWTDDAGCLGLWLSVTQEQVIRYQQPLPTFGVPPAADSLLAQLGGMEILYVGDQAEDVREAHRLGRCFRGEPFGLRVLKTPLSRWPARPAGGFWESLDLVLDAVEITYRQRPFDVVLADCGAYRLPLLRSVHQRYGVTALSTGLPMVDWLTGKSDFST